MRFLPLLCVSLLALGCAGCGPVATFEPYAVKHPLNLETVLGREVTLLGPDTLPLTVRFDPATRRNTLVLKGTHDTLSDAWVTRYRGLYYFTEPRAGAGYYRVYAARIRGGRVQGLRRGEAFAQAEALAGEMSGPLGSPYDGLVLRRNEQQEVLHLRFDARVLRPFYAAVVDTLPVYRCAAPGRPAARPAAAPEPAALIRSVYPNPARDYATVQLAGPGPYTVELLDGRGRRVLEQPVAAADARLAVGALPAGTYLLRVQGAGRRGSRQLVVE